MNEHGNRYRASAGTLTNATRSCISTGDTRITAASDTQHTKRPDPTTEDTASSTSTALPAGVVTSERLLLTAD